MSEYDINELLRKLASLDVKVSEIYQLLVGDHNGLGEKPGLIALCRIHRSKYVEAEERLKKLEITVEELSQAKQKITHWWALLAVLVAAGWAIFTHFHK